VAKVSYITWKSLSAVYIRLGMAVWEAGTHSQTWSLGWLMHHYRRYTLADGTLLTIYDALQSGQSEDVVDALVFLI